jgi:hypothetical protein
MAIRNDFAPGEVLAAADLNDTFGSKLNIAGGKILQIVRDTDTTERTINSASFVDVTGMSVTITPQKSDSAIMLIASLRFDFETTVSTDNTVFFQITDNSNNAISGAESSSIGLAGFALAVASAVYSGDATIIGWATPATTSAVTYKVRGASTKLFKVQNSAKTGQLFAIEVSA